MLRPDLRVQEHNIRVKKGCTPPVPKVRPNSQSTVKGEIYCYTNKTKTESINSRMNKAHNKKTK